MTQIYDALNVSGPVSELGLMRSRLCRHVDKNLPLFSPVFFFLFCFPELCSTFSGVCSIFAGNLVPRTPACYFSFLNYFSCVKASLILHSATSSHDFKKLAKHTEFSFALCRHSAAPRSRASVQLCVRRRDTSRRSMVTFARARMFCRSFSVALGPSAAAAAACSLSSLGLPEVKRRSRRGG